MTTHAKNGYTLTVFQERALLDLLEWWVVYPDAAAQDADTLTGLRADFLARGGEQRKRDEAA